MGKIKQGILGGFNGTTGSVVGASWKGIAYMRGKAQSIKNPRTELQMENRTLFGTLSDIMSKSNSAVKLGCASFAVKKSAFNVAVQENMKLQVDSLPVIQYGSLVFSKGSLTPLGSGNIAHEDNSISAVASLQFVTSSQRLFCGVCVFVGDFPGAPYVLVNKISTEAGANNATFVFTEPTDITYAKAYIFGYEYSEQPKDASMTVHIGDYTPV